MTIKNLYSAYKPSLNLDFANTRRLDARITFSRDSVGTYIGKDGLIKSAAANEARFDHDSDGNSLGLLVEESRTNSFVNSIFRSSWTAQNITKKSNNNPAPDGTNTAMMIGDSTGTSTSSRLFYNLNITGAIRTFSFYAKATTTGQSAMIGYYDAGPNQGYAFINLDDGSITYSNKVGDLVSTSAYIGNGWWRCIVTVTPSGGAAFYWTAGNADSGDIYIWGAQLETGSFPTSYIPTSGSTVTRAADGASITGSNFSSWYNQGEGSFFSQYIPTAGYGEISFFGDSQNFWSVNSANVAGDVFGFRTKSNQGSNSNTFNRGRITAATNYGYVIKHAAAIADNDFACYTSSSSGDVNLNTGSAIPATGGYLPPLVDRLILTDALTGVIRLSRLTYYPTRLPDTILQSLTS